MCGGGGGGLARVCVCVCVRERERERLCCHTNTLVAFFCLIIILCPLYVYVRSTLSKGDEGGLRSHNTCSTLPHIRVDVQSQEPHRH